MLSLSTLTLFQSDLSSYWVHVSTGDYLLTSCIFHTHHLGANGFTIRIIIPRQEQSLFAVLQIWRCVISYQDASSYPRIPLNVIISLLLLFSFGRFISISTSPIQVAHEKIRLRCDGISRWGYGLLNSLHITLPSCRYHTRSANCFLTHLSWKTPLRCLWGGTWISLYQNYDHMCRIFNPGCRF